MEIRTTIAQNIETADVKAHYDEACKRLLSERIILAWILKGCVQEYQDLDIEDIARDYIEGTPQVGVVPVGPDRTNAVLNRAAEPQKTGSRDPEMNDEEVKHMPLISGAAAEDVTMTEGTVFYDIRFFASAPASGETIRLIINIEAQNDFYPGYPLVMRGIYYASRLISAQSGTEFVIPDYGDIKKVYSIWICMDPPGYRQNTINRYHIAEECVVGTLKEERKRYDLLTVIMICLGTPDRDCPSDLLYLLNVLFSPERKPNAKMEILEKDFSIPMTYTLENEVNMMCNFSEGVERRGIAKGLARGISQGLAQGRNEIALRMKLKGLPIEDIAEYTLLTEDEIRALPESAEVLS